MSHPYVPDGFFMRHVVNPITLRVGGPTLIVRGRRTGRPIRTPVPAFVYEGTPYLVAGRGETHWARNLRAAGEGEVRLNGRLVRFRATELEGVERERIIAAYREKLGWTVRGMFERIPDPGDHPVFRIEPIEKGAPVTVRG